jgi:hypothetical protein
MWWDMKRKFRLGDLVQVTGMGMSKILSLHSSYGDLGPVIEVLDMTKVDSRAIYYLIALPDGQNRYFYAEDIDLIERGGQ